MRFIDWNESFSVGVETMDIQHKVLFMIVNKFYNAVEHGADTAELSRIFNEVLEYTNTHFALEEVLMQAHNYPDYEQHKALHVRLVENALVLADEIKAGRAGAPSRALDFLKNWLEKHIQGVDVKYGPCLNSNTNANAA